MTWSRVQSIKFLKLLKFKADDIAFDYLQRSNSRVAFYHSWESAQKTSKKHILKGRFAFCAYVCINTRFAASEFESQSISEWKMLHVTSREYFSTKINVKSFRGCSLKMEQNVNK